MARITEAVGRLAASLVVRRVAAAITLSAAGAAGIVNYEGVEHKVYLDPVGIPTVCVGHIATVTKADVGKSFTDAQCTELLASDSRVAQADVRRLVKAPVTQGQYDALVSFTFNVGGGNLASSTLLKKLNAGDCRGAADEFKRWNKANGRVLPGLVTRRAGEASQFVQDCP
jgi:lysozyme